MAPGWFGCRLFAEADGSEDLPHSAHQRHVRGGHGPGPLDRAVIQHEASAFHRMAVDDAVRRIRQ
jgi:hypothetical protein